jgi:Fe-S-cluster-containing dehydrogenase component
MRKMILIDIDKCTGCGVCELMCSFKHHDEFNPTKARIHLHLFGERELSIPVINNILVSYKGYTEKCDFCAGEPECVKFCARGALKFEEPALGMIAKKKGVAERRSDSYKEVKS